MLVVVVVDSHKMAILKWSKYIIHTKVCGHPLKLVDSAISPTTVADR
jgi:hypothetical protein